jgi:hypothetical protein
MWISTYKVELMLYNYWIQDLIPMTRWSTITAIIAFDDSQIGLLDPACNVLAYGSIHWNLLEDSATSWKILRRLVLLIIVT